MEQALYVTPLDKLAKVIRVITVPPLLVITMICVLAYRLPSVFTHAYDHFIAAFCLGIVPILAYPISYLVPKLRKKGREGERNLAFVLSVVGYGTSLVLGFVLNASKKLLLIYLTYFLSVLILVFCNKLLHLRASGHACSITGPLVFLVYYLGASMVLPCLLIGAVSFWASIHLKRHKGTDLLLGTMTCLVAFVCSFSILVFC